MHAHVARVMGFANFFVNSGRSLGRWQERKQIHKKEKSFEAEIWAGRALLSIESNLTLRWLCACTYKILVVADMFHTAYLRRI
jgi:methyl coenzyme M reductase subunit D